jgi:Ras-related protein Rab-8A
MDHHQQSNGASAGAAASQQNGQHPPRPLQMGAKGAYIVRLLMVGDSACGKTSLVLRFDQNVFSTKFVTTIGVDYRDKMVKIEGATMRLQLWDTAGQERFRSLTSNFFGRADGFVLTFDVSNRPSFDHVVGWMRDIKTRAPPDCDIVLCGNKSDLDNDRVVAYEEGKQLADEYGVQFFETSALTGQNVEKMFTALAATIKRKRIDDLEGYQNGGGGGHGGGGIQGAGSGDNGSTGGESRTIHLGGGGAGPGGQQGGMPKASSCCQ